MVNLYNLFYVEIDFGFIILLFLLLINLDFVSFEDCNGEFFLFELLCAELQIPINCFIYLKNILYILIIQNIYKL